MKTYVVNCHGSQPESGEAFKVINECDGGIEYFICVSLPYGNKYVCCANCAFNPSRRDSTFYCERFPCSCRERIDGKWAFYIEIKKNGFDPPFKNWVHKGTESERNKHYKEVFKALGTHQDAWAKVLQARQEEQKKG